MMCIELNHFNFPDMGDKPQVIGSSLDFAGHVVTFSRLFSGPGTSERFASCFRRWMIPVTEP